MPMGFTIILLRIKTYKAALSFLVLFFLRDDWFKWDPAIWKKIGGLVFQDCSKLHSRWSILDILLVEEIPNNHLVNNGINYRPQLVQDFWTINSHTQQKGHFYLNFTDSPTYIYSIFHLNVLRHVTWSFFHQRYFYLHFIMTGGNSFTRPHVNNPYIRSHFCWTWISKKTKGVIFFCASGYVLHPGNLAYRT